ncbi:MAG: dihydroorotate dehydrogenase [Synergistaceae bacterium]|jgi:dihydroorotate dehydrogenase (NAD+) catalytic subunit|nr:dihydroorotate dehydrogenase [Synergistaceae bacterium]
MMTLETELCGVLLKNPMIAASGTFGFGEEYSELYDISCWGAISVKGLTNRPRSGNPPHRIAETASGMLNSVGLENPGVDAFMRNELPRLARQGIPIIANVAGSTIDDYRESVGKLSDSPVSIIELNISCPNVREGGVQFGTSPERVREVTSAVRSCTSKPLMIKLSPNVSDISEIARAAEDAGADAISLINTITGMAIDAKTRRPILANVTGGLSGPAIKPVALRMVWQAAAAVSIPIVGMGGIMNADDVAQFMLAGARAVMIGTANIVDPMAGPRILAEIENFMQENEISDIRELVGGLRTS